MAVLIVSGMQAFTRRLNKRKNNNNSNANEEAGEAETNCTRSMDLCVCVPWIIILKSME